MAMVVAVIPQYSPCAAQEDDSILLSELQGVYFPGMLPGTVLQTLIHKCWTDDQWANNGSRPNPQL